MRRLAIFSFSFAAAALCAGYLPLENRLLFLGGMALLVYALAWLPLKRQARARKAVRWAAAGLALGFFWTAGYSALVWKPARDLDDTTIRLQGTVAQWPQETDYGWSVQVRLEPESGPDIRTLLYLDGQGADLRPGDKIETVAHCSRADRAASGEKITYYTSQGIFLTARAYGRLDVERPERLPIRDWPAHWTRALEEGVNHVFPEDAAPLVKALVTGSREDLSDSLNTDLQRTGLTHTVAVSGSHLVLLSELLSLLLLGSRRRTALVLIPVSILFTLMTGCTPSIVRAAIMIILLQIAPLLGRERDSLTALGTALLLLLIWNPLSITHVGLQLSFAAVAGILLCSGRIQEAAMARMPFAEAKRWSPAWCARRILTVLVSTLAATVGASVFTTPLTALYFNSVPLISLLSNLLTLWAISGLFSAGLILGAAGILLPQLAALPAGLVSVLGRYLIWMIEHLSQTAFAAITLDTVYYRAWLVFVYFLVLFVILQRGKRRWIFPICAGVSTLCLAMVLNSLSFWQGAGAVTALDVGQGQSVLVRTGRFLALVDCGGDGYDNAGDVAANYLGDRGIRRLDLLVLTHFHEDHANGVTQLLRRLEVGLLAIPDVEPDSPVRQEIMALAEQQGVQVLLIQTDTTLELEGGQSIRLFAPLGSGETNEEGLTFLASQGKFDVLITGDMGSDVEELLLAHTQLPDVEVLVVGHHGSKYSASEALLDQIQPEYALISVGADNLYGHPAQETMGRIAAAGGTIYRTDLFGTTTIRSNK